MLHLTRSNFELFILPLFTNFTFIRFVFWGSLPLDINIFRQKFGLYFLILLKNFYPFASRINQ
jgi:hypothetical protein